MKVGDLVKIDEEYGCWFERPSLYNKVWKGIWLVTMIEDKWAQIAKGNLTNVSIPLDCLEKVE